MIALNFLNQVIANKSALVPCELISQIVSAANALGIRICGGALSDDAKKQVLYID